MGSANIMYQQMHNAEFGKVKNRNLIKEAPQISILRPILLIISTMFFNLLWRQNCLFANDIT